MDKGQKSKLVRWISSLQKRFLQPRKKSSCERRDNTQAVRDEFGEKNPLCLKESSPSAEEEKGTSGAKAKKGGRDYARELFKKKKGCFSGNRVIDYGKRGGSYPPRGKGEVEFLGEE